MPLASITVRFLRVAFPARQQASETDEQNIYTIACHDTAAVCHTSPLTFCATDPVDIDQPGM
jgi:hypothetical protein